MFEHWKDHFHPHEGNNHKPHAYQAGGAIALGLVILAIVAFSGLQTTLVTQSERFLAAVLPSVLVDLANEDRAEEGLPSLEPNETLQEAAQLKANHMAELGYFAHDAPDGTTPWEWFQAAGYEYELAGENLAVNFSDSDDVEDAWMDSPTHRENILEQGFTEIGIATAEGEYEGEETIFVVQMFGRPSEAELADRDGGQRVAVANAQEEPADEPAPAEDVEPEPQPEPEPTSAPSEAPAEEEPEPTPAPTSAEEPAEETQEDTSQPATLASAESGEASQPEESTTTDAEEPATAEGADADDNQVATPTAVAQVQGEAGISLLPFSGSIERQASQFAHLLSQPEFIFKTLVLTLFALIALALLISVGVEAKRHHVNHALKSLGALAVLMLVFFFGTTFLFEDPEVAADSYSDSRLSADMSLVEFSASR